MNDPAFNDAVYQGWMWIAGSVVLFCLLFHTLTRK
jgi:hypothetical protein